MDDLVTAGRTALLFQEVQEGVIGPGAALKDLAAVAETVGLIPHATRLAHAAREAGVRVVHCTAENLATGFGANHNARLFAAAKKLGAIGEEGSVSVAPISGLLELGDIVLPRYHGLSPLTGTQLDSVLRNEGITTLIVAGVSLNFAIPNLVFDAINRAYQVVVPRDVVAGVPLEYGEQVISHTIDPIATVVTSEELIASWSIDRYSSR
jgi:nicotinamidase-related amidase